MKGRRKKRKHKRVNNRKNMQHRLLGLFLFMVLCMIGLCIKITYINVTQGQNYSNIVLKQQSYETKTLPFRRGDIVDRNGVTLATSIKVYNIILEPKTMRSNDGKYLEPTIRALCNCFGYDEQEIRKIVADNPDSQYHIYKKGLTEKDIEMFTSLREGTLKPVPLWFKNADGVEYPGTYIKGVWLEEEYVRIYPYDEVACDIIGFVNAGNAGATGIELQYNSVLNGINGRKYGYVNSDSDVESVVQAPIDGNTVVSTIDINIQKIVQDKISEFQSTVGSKNTAVIVMNPTNGEIYSMASYPFHNLNSPRDLSAFYTEEEIALMDTAALRTAYFSLWRDYCISDTYEPGSTAKIFTVAAALEEGTSKDGDSFMCKGVLNVDKWPIHCHNRYGHNRVTLKESVMYSCNVAMMELAAKMGKNTFSKYHELFGMGQLTGIDLPAEVSADKLHLTADEKMNIVDLATYSFGQNFNVTMIQMAAAYASVINGGYYYEPHVLKRINDAGGSMISETAPLLVKQTVSNKTSDLLREYLESVVTEGTAKNVAIEGYTIGGKTGTAEKSNKDKKSYLVSFIGFAPVDNPEVLVYVIVDEPNVEKQSNSTYASNLAKGIMEEILPYLNVYSTKEPEPVVPDTDTSDTKVDETQGIAEPETANPSYYEEWEGSIIGETTSISQDNN